RAMGWARSADEYLALDLLVDFGVIRDPVAHVRKECGFEVAAQLEVSVSIEIQKDRVAVDQAIRQVLSQAVLHFSALGKGAHLSVRPFAQSSEMSGMMV